MMQNVQPAGSVLTNYGIVAWIVYGVLSGGGHWLGALVVALAILAHEYRCHAVKILNCTAAAFFAFSLMTTIAVRPALFKNYTTFLTWFGVRDCDLGDVAHRISLHPPVRPRAGAARGLRSSAVHAPQRHSHRGLRPDVHGQCRIWRDCPDDRAFADAGPLLPISLLIACIVFSTQYPQRYFQRFAPDWVAAQAAKEGRADD
jgi:hypothetical protein